jgi:hypothetical protein
VRNPLFRFLGPRSRYVAVMPRVRAGRAVAESAVAPGEMAGITVVARPAAPAIRRAPGRRSYQRDRRPITQDVAELVVGFGPQVAQQGSRSFTPQACTRALRHRNHEATRMIFAHPTRRPHPAGLGCAEPARVSRIQEPKTNHETGRYSVVTIWSFGACAKNWIQVSCETTTTA